MSEVVVVGGGLAGLVAARRLAAAGVEVELFERRAELGGRVRTRHHAGATLDRGFQVLLTAYPAVRRELDLASLELRPFTPGAIIARPGRRSLLSDPFRDRAAALATLANREITLLDKLRVVRLHRRLRRRDPESIFPGPSVTIETYLLERGFSRGFIDRFVAPFYGGITLDRSLSTAAAVFEYTFKMLAEGDIAVPASGMGAIPDQLTAAAREAGAEIETGVEVTGIDAGDEGAGVTVELGGESVAAEAVVLASDPVTARELTGLASIPTTGRGCVTQYYGLPANVELTTGGRLVLNPLDDGPNHVAQLSAVAPEYAPPGEHLLVATYLGTRAEDDAALARTSHDALASWFPAADFADLRVIATDRIEFAQFAQPPGCHAGLPATDRPDGDVYLAGDYTAWSSIQGALESGWRAAATVLWERS